MRLTLKEVEARVNQVVDRAEFDRDFIFDLLLAYGRSQGNITRLRSTSASSLNIAENPDTEVAQKNVLYFKEVELGNELDLLTAVEELSKSPLVVRFNTRFVIVTDYRTLMAKDTKTGETLTTEIQLLADHFTFFLPWAGMEKAQFIAEAHADVKAAERMAKLFDELLKENPESTQSQAGRHSLNIFFTRLLFCFFAEDTGIFGDGQFTRAVASLTQPDGSDLQEFLTDVFVALDTQNPADKPSHLARFPYVNGHLFTVKSDQVVPRFNKKARDYLLESGKLLWNEINPDIFGSMFQAIVTPGQRSDLGQHYTSVPNILKTIEPLFLDELREEFNLSFENEKKLVELLARIAKIKIFDPACGSGNFLVIAYKELRKLEHAILERLEQFGGKYQTLFAESQIRIENFYGIEIDDFAVEVAILSLWLAKHQMNREFYEKFNIDLPLIPLKESGNVVKGNAARIDWNEVCPNDGETEIYLIGNPPYLGSRNQTAAHKEDLKSVTPNYKSLDYVSAWFIKGADYLRVGEGQLAFVSTNSITQGEQVGLLWPKVLGKDLEIGYAYTSFKWSNSAKGAAGVTCVVINLRHTSNETKTLFSDDVARSVSTINPYLAEGPVVWIGRRSKPLVKGFPKLGFGSMPNDKGNLILSEVEKNALLVDAPDAARFIRGYSGSDEFIKGKSRYCLVISDQDLEFAKSIEPIARRLAGVVTHREKSTEKSTRAAAEQPHRFYFFAHQNTDAIIVPATSSERREYIPIGFLDRNTVISNSANAAYDAEPWVFGLLTSRMHMVWTRAVAGALETRIRYSNTIVYNNFPVPPLSKQTKEQLTEGALRILDVREYHSELTLADLYDPDKMPDNLRRAHRELDELVDSIYRKREFASDEERLSLLFDLYAKMTDAEGKK